MTQEQQIAELQRQLNWLTAQVTYLFNRNQIPFVSLDQKTINDGRTETGMGAIVSPDKSSYI